MAAVVAMLLTMVACGRADETCTGDDMDIEQQLDIAQDAAGAAAQALGIEPTDIEVRDRDGKTALGKDDPSHTVRAFRGLGTIVGVDDDEAAELLDRAQGVLEDDWSFVPSDSSALSRWSNRGEMTATITISGADPSGSRNALAEVTTACVPTADLPAR
jgi:hypothetical protein